LLRQPKTVSLCLIQWPDLRYADAAAIRLGPSGREALPGGNPASKTNRRAANTLKSFDAQAIYLN
jgi:hypothetical protein